MASGRDKDTLQNELIWLEISEPAFTDKAKSKGLSFYLVPLGCATTAGVLVKGLHNLYKKDSLKQQLFMRYRILAQGITLVIAMFAMLNTERMTNTKIK